MPETRPLSVSQNCTVFKSTVYNLTCVKQQNIMTYMHSVNSCTMWNGGRSLTERRTRDWKVAGLVESLQERRGNFLLQELTQFLFWLLFRYLFHPRVTAVVRKRSQSFCQKCRWRQVTLSRLSTHTPQAALHEWHGAWLYGVHWQHWLAPRRLQFHVAPARQRCKYTRHFGGRILKNKTKQKMRNKTNSASEN